MNVQRDLLRTIDWSAAIDATVPGRGEFFPSRVEAFAARANAEPFQRLLTAHLARGRSLGPAEIVYVPRRTIGTRPAFDASFRDRVVLAGLAAALEQRLSATSERLAIPRTGPERLDDVHADFEYRPLRDPHARAVLIADVSAFYEYVDHQLLVDDVVELTGDVDLAEAIGSALADLVGRGFGLPQGPRGSDVFADFYLSQIDRELMRRGIVAHRHNDEFRVPVANVDEGRRVLLELEQLLRGIGLVLNPAKTRIPSREEYEGWLGIEDDEADMAAFVQAGDQEDDDLVWSDDEDEDDSSEEDWFAFDDADGYGFDPDTFFDVEEEEPADEGESVDASLDARFLEWLSRADRDPAGGPAYGKLVRLLPRLAAAGSTAPLEHLDNLVVNHAWLVRPVGLYLRSLTRTEVEEAMVETVQQVLDGPGFVSPWAKGWLYHALAFSQDLLPPPTEARLSNAVHDIHLPWFARARALVAMAKDERLPDQSTVADLFRAAPATARADVVAAVAISRPRWARRFMRSTAGDPLLPVVPRLIEEADDGYREVI